MIRRTSPGRCNGVSPSARPLSSFAGLQPRHHPGLRAQGDERRVAAVARNQTLRRAAGLQALALARRHDRCIEVDGQRARLTHPLRHHSPAHVPEQFVAFGMLRDEGRALLALDIVHARDREAVETVAQRTGRGKAALAPARAKPDPGRSASKEEEQAPARGREARPGCTSPPATRTAAPVRRGPSPPCLPASRLIQGAARRDEGLHPAGDDPRGGLGVLTHCTQ